MTGEDRPDAVEQEREMHEHEREAQERESDEASGEPGTLDDEGKPAAPGNIQRGGLSGS